MRYAAMTTEQLKMTEANARAEIAKGGSAAVMRARYGVLGALSAELANRKPATPKGCGYCAGLLDACPACFQ